MHGRRPCLPLVTLLLLLACAPEAFAQASLTPLPSFSAPLYLTAPPNDSRRVFVVERSGVIHVVRDGVKLETPFLDIDADVQGGGEEGLLSMAFAPDYATSRRFYVYYTGNDGNNYVEEFQRSATVLDQADPGSRRRVLQLMHVGEGNHNGGQLHFGPDGYLYIGTGDGGGSNDGSNNAQTLTGDPFNGDKFNPLLGKLLRIDPRQSGDQAYSVPSDNPYAGSPGGARPEIWAYGLRNPWRYTFDRATGDLVIGDVGQGRAEEVDWSPSGSGGGKGANYGWRCYEGKQSTPGVPDCEPPGHVLPVLEHLQSNTSFCAIVGGYVVRDPSLGSLNGRYIYGDNCEDDLRSTVLAAPDAQDDQATGHKIGGVTSFGEDACGRLYVTSFSGVFRFDGNPAAGCSLPDPYPAGSDSGAGGPGGGGPGTGTPPDTDPPVVTLSRKRRQPILRQRGVILAMTCSEACAASATGWISIPGAARVFKLRPVRRSLDEGERARVKLRLRRKAVRPLRRALRRGRRVRSKVRVRAVDPAGNSRVVKRRVSARRP